MSNNFMIISNSQERVSKYFEHLQDYSSECSFSPDYCSAIYRIKSSNLSFLIIDNVDENKGLIKFLGELRQDESLQDLVVIIITRDQGCPQGLEALQVGADDYISLSLLGRELAVRIQIHLNKKNKNDKVIFEHVDVDLDAVFPIEDRVLIKKSLVYINNNISTLKKVDDLAVYLDKSVRFLNRVFAEHLGETVFEYIRRFRIKKAKELILTTRVFIVDIAEEVGYSSAENFSTAFKAVVGLSPTEYRKQKKLQK